MIEKSLINKNVLITGAGGLLGSHFAEIFIKNECKIILIDNNKITIDKNYLYLKNKYNHKNISRYVCDVSNESQVNKTVKSILKKYKKIDILINNASTKTKSKKKFFSKVENYDYKTFNEVLSVNLGGMFLFAQKIGNSMIKNKKGGSIIQISSIYGSISPDEKIYQGIKDQTVSPSPISYMISKSAIEGMTKYLAAHWGKHKIRVNCISPGGVDSNLDKNFKKNYINKVPLNRMASIEDLNGIVIYLSSDMSLYVTGQNFFVDGGYSII